MLRYEEALANILARVEPLPAENVSVSKLHGKVIARQVVASIDSPPFDNSAVDGFGVKVADIENASLADPVVLSLNGVVRAGDAGNIEITAGSAVKILTGAPVPQSVEAVVMKEVCSETDGGLAVRQAVAAGENIRRRGGEFLRGKEVLSAGVLATPPVVGLIAGLGYRTFPAFRMPTVAIITTGNELIKPGRLLSPGKIYDSNSYAMEAAVRALGITAVTVSHAGEDESATTEAFKRALSYADVIISTGGVSVGDYDFVKGALEKLQVETHIWRIAIKPGKPVYFGVQTSYPDGIMARLAGLRRGAGLKGAVASGCDQATGSKALRRRYVFGLPGNPVSALVTFRLLAMPALTKLMGLTQSASLPKLQAMLAKPVSKKAGRLEFLRGRLYCDGVKLIVEPTDAQESHMLSGLAKANALITFPLEAEQIASGQTVEVQLLDW